MKKINEHTKVTLTLKQLRQLVGEAIEWPKSGDIEGWARLGKAFPNLQEQHTAQMERADHAEETIYGIRDKLMDLMKKYKDDPVADDLNKLWRYIGHRLGNRVGGFPMDDPYK